MSEQISTDVERARARLAETGATCVLCKGDAIYESSRRGVSYLMSLIDEGRELRGFSAADKVVGKATALLLALCGVVAVHAGVLSEQAERVLAANGIAYTADARAEYIINREGTGKCPMEQATRDIDDPRLAPNAIRAAAARLKQIN